MKKYLVIAGLLAFASCDNGQGKENVTHKSLEVATGVSTGKTDTLCFIRTEGIKNQDTGLLHLVISNDRVTGTLNVLPFEKDARRGTLEGRKQGDEISGTWTYEQEGMKESMRVAFRLKGDQLLQKAATFDPASGKEVLPDTASYSVVYSKTDCNPISGK